LTPPLEENTKFFEKINIDLPSRPAQDVSRPKIYPVGVACGTLSFDILKTQIQLQFLWWQSLKNPKCVSFFLFNFFQAHRARKIQLHNIAGFLNLVQFQN